MLSDYKDEYSNRNCILFEMSNLENSIEAEDGNNIPNVQVLCFGYNGDISKVQTVEFLESSKYVVCIIEKMGKVFSPLKYDMNGNITKITATLKKNETAYQYLEDMVLTEKAAGDNIAVDALQWLRRGLHFIAKFFECVLDDTEHGTNEANLTPFIKTAYNVVLQRYHGWMGGQLFNIIFNLAYAGLCKIQQKTIIEILCRFTPNRNELYKILSSDDPYNEEDVIRSMKIFTTNLMKCINHLVKFYHDNNLENEAVV